MSNDKSHNEKLPIEDLFRDVFSDHKETVEEKDFDQFLGKLEETDFFDKNKRRPLFIFLFAFVILCGSIFYFTLGSKKEIQKSIESSSVKSSDTSLTKPVETTGKQNDEEKFDKPNPGSSVTQEMSPPLAPDRINSQPPNIKTQEAPATTQIKIEEPVVETKDTAGINVIAPPTVSKHLKDSIRIKYVMQVDTIKTTDSLNIKKRKWEKMKGKNK